MKKQIKRCLSDKKLTKENQDHLRQSLQSQNESLTTKQQQQVDGFHQRIDWNKLT